MSDDKTKVFSAMRARTQENIARQKAEEYTPTTAYVRDSFISERLRDQGIPIPDDGFYSEDVAREQGAWHRWLAAHDEAVRADMQREVRTVEELDALPVGSVVVDQRGISSLKGLSRNWLHSNTIGATRHIDPTNLPARILFTPSTPNQQGAEQ